MTGKGPGVGRVTLALLACGWMASACTPVEFVVANIVLGAAIDLMDGEDQNNAPPLAGQPQTQPDRQAVAAQDRRQFLAAQAAQADRERRAEEALEREANLTAARFAEIAAEREVAAARTQRAALALADVQIAAMIPVRELYVVRPEGTVFREVPSEFVHGQPVARGTLVTVTGKSNEWFRIELEAGRTGFSLARNFEKAPTAGRPAALARDAEAPRIEISGDLRTRADIFEIVGLVTDANRVAEVTVQGGPATVDENGRFRFRIYVPPQGLSVRIVAVDEFGNRAERDVQVGRIQ
jgi:hypothetical protein